MNYKKFNKKLLGAVAFLGLAGTINISNADILHLDDVIIDFSLCVGNDCNNGESFGFDTVRLKENNVRIHFDDTSNSASFPRNDWRITINDSSNGGGSYFSIDDATAGRQVFRVDAGAPANSLRVDSGGDVGIGTSNPVVDIHDVSGNTPTLRLEQNGSSGFAAQTWDLAGNEANFFIRDVTNGSKLPFRLKPGAPSDSIFVASDGDIGLGTDSPANKFHIENTGGDNEDDFVVTNNGYVGIGTDSPAVYDTVVQAYVDINGIAGAHPALVLNSYSANETSNLIFASGIANTKTWMFSSRNSVGAGTDGRLSLRNTVGTEVMTFYQDAKVGFGVGSVDAANAIEHSNGARLTTGGVWTDASSRELKEAISDIPLEIAKDALLKLNPVTFSYKSEPKETYAGFIAEDVPELVATADRKGLAPMDIVAVLTKVLQEQQKTISDLNKRLELLEVK